MMPGKMLKDIENNFFISLREMKKIIADFHSEMRKGLSGRKSSLKMIPTYAKRPRGSEKGIFLALDLGGTNFRVFMLELKGNRKIASLVSRKFVLKKRHITRSGKELFDFIAGCIKKFLKERKKEIGAEYNIGFTFSFPVKQKSINSGVLIRWTKGFMASGVEGEDIVVLLNKSLRTNGLSGARVVGLANDTVSTLVARSYEDPDCDIGVILGTGTNACYCEKPSMITKLKSTKNFPDDMIINIEWGNFDKLPVTAYDADLDKHSENRNEQVLEKMVSGMYLGEVARIVIKDLICRKEIFPGTKAAAFDMRNAFKSEYMSLVEGDSSKGLSAIGNILKGLGIPKTSLEDRKKIKEICSSVSTRAARISATAMAAVITKRDPALREKHTIAIDGSVYEKHPHFSSGVRSSLIEIFGKSAKNIKITLTKDASGKGAAVIAASNYNVKSVD